MTRRPLAVTLLLVLALLIGGVAPADAKESPAEKRRRKAEIERRIKSLRNEVEQATDEEDRLADEVADAESRRLALDRKVVALEGRIKATQSEVAAAEAKLGAIESELARTLTELAATEQKLTSSKEELRDRAVTAYIGQPTSEMADLALGVKDVRELTALTTYYKAVVKAQTETVEEYRALRGQIDDLRVNLQGTRAAAAGQRDKIGERKRLLELRRKEQDDARRAVAAEQVAEQGLLDEVKRRVADYQSQIVALQAESQSIASFLKNLQVGQGPPVSGRGVLAVPLPGARITSRFGYRTHPILGTQRLHTGIDFGAGSGTPIRASADGVVVAAGPRGGYGEATIIDHGNSLATLYAHQSALLVAAGERVTRGQVIGRVGSTGFSTGPHLHFEVRVTGTPVDPLPYL